MNFLSLGIIDIGCEIISERIDSLQQRTRFRDVPPPPRALGVLARSDYYPHLTRRTCQQWLTRLTTTKCFTVMFLETSCIFPLKRRLVFLFLFIELLHLLLFIYWIITLRLSNNVFHQIYDCNPGLLVTKLKTMFDLIEIPSKTTNKDSWAQFHINGLRIMM